MLMTCFVVVQTVMLLSAVINASLSLTEVNVLLLSKMTPKANGLMT